MSELTNSEVLQKVIDKSIANGHFKPYIGEGDTLVNRDVEAIYPHVHSRCIYNDGSMNFRANGRVHIDRIIFSHVFAKVFWGEKEFDGQSLKKVLCQTHTFYFKTMKEWMEESDDKFYEWEYHLQKMVLEKNPIDYLRKFI